MNASKKIFDYVQTNFEYFCFISCICQECMGSFEEEDDMNSNYSCVEYVYNPMKKLQQSLAVCFIESNVDRNTPGHGKRTNEIIFKQNWKRQGKGGWDILKYTCKIVSYTIKYNSI